MKLIQNWKLRGRGTRERPPASPARPPRDAVLDWSPESIATDEAVDELLGRIWRDWQRDRASYERSILPILRHAIRFYGPLPASKKDHHAYQNGMIIHLLQVAHKALKAAPGVIEPGPEMKGAKKERNEIAYYQGLVMVSLLHDVGKTMSDFRVFLKGADQPVMWRPESETLADFCERHDHWAIRWEWRAGRHKQHEAYVPTFFGYWMRDLGIDMPREIWQKWFDAARCLETSQEHSLIIKADGRSAKLDKQLESHFSTGKESLGDIKEIVQDMLHVGDWKINRKGDPIWFSKHGLHIVYEKGFNDIINRIDRRTRDSEDCRIASAAELLRKFDDAGIIASHTSSSGEKQQIEQFIPASFEQGKKKLHGIRVTRPEAIGISVDQLSPTELRLYADSEGRPFESEVGSEHASGTPRPSSTAEHTKQQAEDPDRDAQVTLQYLARDKKYLSIMQVTGSGVSVPWPTGLEGLGMPAERVLDALKKAGWAADPVDDDGEMKVWLLGKAAEKIQNELARSASTKEGEGEPANVGESSADATDDEEEESQVPEVVEAFVAWLVQEAEENGFDILTEPDEEAEGVVLIDDGERMVATKSVMFNFLGLSSKFGSVSSNALMEELVGAEIGTRCDEGLALDPVIAEQLRRSSR